MKRILFVFFSLAVALFPYAPKAIGAVNLPPVFSGSDYAAGEVDKALDFTLVYSDPDGDPVTLTMNLPSGAMYDESTQNFHWVPTTAGSYTATFTASDGIENTVRVIQIDVVDANNPPIFSGDVETSTQVGDELEFTVIGSDPDGDALVITASLPIGATYDASSGLFQWMPDAEGTFVASFTADDGRSSTTRIVTITVLPPLLQNNLPIFSGDTSASTTVNTLLEFTLVASDPDGDSITLTTMLPSGAIYATSTGRFSWTATSTGMFHAKFFASDGYGTSTRDVLIEVADAIVDNRSPQFVNFNPLLTATSTVLYGYDIDASDPDNDPLTFMLVKNPDGMLINATSGLVTWMPTGAQATSTPHVVSVEVSDGLLSATTTYAIVVSALPLPQNNLPIFSGDTSASTTVNTLLEFTLVASDPDGDSITLTTMLPSGAIYATSTGRFSWTATSTGMFHAKFFASDGYGTSTRDVLIEVVATPSPTPTPTPTPTPPSGGGGGGGGCCPGNGPPGLFNLPTPTPLPSPTPSPPTGGSPNPTSTSTPANNPVPLQPTPKPALLPRKEVLENISSPLIAMATSAPAESRSVASVLLAGLFNLFDWTRAHWCDIGWLLWLLTLLAFILYIFLSREKEKEPEVGDSEAPEGMLVGERSAENNINEYWETYVPTELGTPQEKES